MRTLPALQLRGDDRIELERRAVSSELSPRIVRRARVILLAARGMSNRQIGAALDLHYNRVSFWRRRYQELGLKGLEDEERPGRPAIYGPREVLQLVRLLSEPGDVSGGRWTLAGLSGALAERGIPISRSQVRRLCSSIEVDSGFSTASTPAARPLPIDCPIEIVGLFVGERTRAVLSAVAEPGSKAPAGALEALEAQTSARELSEALRRGRTSDHALSPPGPERVVELARRLLSSLPESLALSCTVAGLPALAAGELASLAPGRLHVHTTGTEESWTTRLNLLLALVEEQFEAERDDAEPRWPHGGPAPSSPSDSLVVGLHALLRRLRRSGGSWTWVARTPEVAAAS